MKYKSKLIIFYLEVSVNRVKFLASTCTSLSLRSKPVQGNQTEQRVIRVNKIKIIGENTLNGDYLGIGCNHGSSNYEKYLFDL